MHKKYQLRAIFEHPRGAATIFGCVQFLESQLLRLESANSRHFPVCVREDVPAQAGHLIKFFFNQQFWDYSDTVPAFNCVNQHFKLREHWPNDRFLKFSIPGCSAKSSTIPSALYVARCAVRVRIMGHHHRLCRTRSLQ